MQPDAFIRANTHVDTAALVPELSLMLATHITPIWLASETALQQANVEPPFWAFAWPGGQALARFIIDQPEAVRGRRVLDFAAGCGLAGLAAKRAGAKHVEAAEIDPFSVAAIALNAALNGLDVTAVGDDLVGCACRWDLILCGDVCYEARMARRILPWLQRLAEYADVWIADPGRAYLPAFGLSPIVSYCVPTSLELEDREERRVTIYRLLLHDLELDVAC